MMFIKKDGEIFIHDRVIYKLPGWVPKDVIAHWSVRKDLEKIFFFRREVVEKLFISEAKD